jgi:dsDNA-specific endonuclease/ATPase MutS2
LISILLQRGAAQERVLFDVLERICSKLELVSTLSVEDIAEFKKIIELVKALKKRMNEVCAPKVYIWKCPTDLLPHYYTLLGLKY